MACTTRCTTFRLRRLMNSKITTYYAPIGVGLPEPITVKTAADAERLGHLIQQTSSRTIQARFRAGADWGVREGIRLGMVAGATASVDEVVEACLASPRARPRMTVVKDIERDPEGRVVRVVERPA
jgi:hypothetical protein